MNDILLKDKLVDQRVASYVLTLITRLDVAVCMQFLFFVKEKNLLDTLLEDYPEYFMDTKHVCTSDQLEYCIKKIDNHQPVHDMPFDVFGKPGKNGFLNFLSNVLNKNLKVQFSEHVRQQMCVPTNHLYDDLKKICALRNYLEHKSKKESVLDFVLLSQTVDNTSVALEAFFNYIPLEFINVVCQLLGENDNYLSKSRKKLSLFNTQYNWNINVKGKKNQSINTKIHRKRLFAFIGKNNMDHIGNIIDSLNKHKHINKNLTDPERVKIFDVILQIHAVFRRYVTPYIEENASDNVKKLRNNIAHSHLFFCEDKNYFNQVRKNIETALDFFEANSKIIDKNVRSNFIRCIFNVLNKKDYNYIVMKKSGQEHNVHIIEIKHIEKQKNITKDYLRACAEKTILDKKSNPNNEKAEFVLCKRQFLNMFRQTLKHHLLKVYPRVKEF